MSNEQWQNPHDPDAKIGRTKDGATDPERVPETFTADKGYFALEEIGRLQEPLDAGGMRRTTLRGLENLNKRHQIAAACYNLSRLLRRLYGVGTPKQWVASFAGFFLALKRLLFTLRCLFAPNRSTFSTTDTFPRACYAL